jgi:hypothetical protein
VKTTKVEEAQFFCAKVGAALYMRAALYMAYLTGMGAFGQSKTADCNLPSLGWDQSAVFVSDDKVTADQYYKYGADHTGRYHLRLISFHD